MKLNKIILIILLVLTPAIAQSAIDSWTPIGPWGGSVKQIAFNPNNSQIVYAATNGVGVYRSADGGTTWVEHNSGLNNLTAFAIAVVPTSPTAASVYVGFNNGGGMAKIADDGQTWSTINNGLSANSISAIVPDPNNILRLFILDRIKGVYRTDDGGASWVPVSTGLPIVSNAFSLESLAIDASNPNTLYVGTKENQGIYRTTTGGDRPTPNTNAWTQIPSSANFTAVTGIQVDPNNSDIVYALTGPTTYKSTNGGTSWNPVNGNTNGTNLVMDPTNSDILYVMGSGVVGSGIVRSTNGGQSWFTYRNGLESIALIQSIAVDPANNLHLLLGNTSAGIFNSEDRGVNWQNSSNGMAGLDARTVSIDIADNNRVISNTPIGVVQTTNGGDNWNIINDPLFDRYFTLTDAIYSPFTANKLFAYTFNLKHFSTSDQNGAIGTWNSLNNGNVEAALFRTIQFHPTNPNIMYMSPNTTGPNKNPNLIVTTNGGSTWIQSTSATGFTLPGYPRSFALDPVTPSTIYAATYNQGVYVTNDGGGSWNSASNGLPAGQILQHIVVHPTDPDIVYLATFGAEGIYKTVNGGQLWTSTKNGLPENVVYSIEIDKFDPRIIYLGTPNGIYKSINNGDSWFALQPGIVNRVNDIAIDYQDRHRIYAASIAGVLEYTRANSAPSAVVNAPNTAMQETPVQFDASASNDSEDDKMEYQWDFGDGAQATGINASHAFAAGTHQVRLLVTDGSLTGETQAEIIVKDPNNTDPQIPSLVFPDDSAVDLDTEIQFIWEKANDDDGDQLSYRFAYCKNANFVDCGTFNVVQLQQPSAIMLASMGSPFALLLLLPFASTRFRRALVLSSFLILFISSCSDASQSAGDTGPNLPANQLSYTVRNLDGGTQYYWKVIVDDGRGGVVESTPRSLTTR